MYIALSGRPGTGKTTVAHVLEQRGFYLINFTDNLKGYAARALRACGMDTTLEEIQANKERYRPFLRALSDAIGYSHESRYIDMALLDWQLAQAESEQPISCVFDNVRTPEQWQHLKSKGFILVNLASSCADPGHKIFTDIRELSMERGLAEIADISVERGTMTPVNLASHLIELVQRVQQSRRTAGLAEIARITQETGIDD